MSLLNNIYVDRGVHVFNYAWHFNKNFQSIPCRRPFVVCERIYPVAKHTTGDHSTVYPITHVSRFTHTCKSLWVYALSHQHLWSVVQFTAPTNIYMPFHPTPLATGTNRSGTITPPSVLLHLNAVSMLYIVWWLHMSASVLRPIISSRASCFSVIGYTCWQMVDGVCGWHMASQNRVMEMVQGALGVSSINIYNSWFKSSYRTE